MYIVCSSSFVLGPEGDGWVMGDGDVGNSKSAVHAVVKMAMGRLTPDFSGNGSKFKLPSSKFIPRKGK